MVGLSATSNSLDQMAVGVVARIAYELCVIGLTSLIGIRMQVAFFLQVLEGFRAGIACVYLGRLLLIKILMRLIHNYLSVCVLWRNETCKELLLLGLSCVLSRGSCR